MEYKLLEDHDKQQTYLNCARILIESVLDVLCSSRNQKFPMTSSSVTAGRRAGIRNGSVFACEGDSDVGTDFDGLSFHYLDKFLFALCR